MHNYVLLKIPPTEKQAFLSMVMLKEAWDELKEGIETFNGSIEWLRGNGQWESSEAFMKALVISPLADHVANMYNTQTPEMRANMPRMLVAILDFYDDNDRYAVNREELMPYVEERRATA